MKKATTLAAAAAMTIVLAPIAFAGPVGVSRAPAAMQPDYATIAKLEKASQRAVADGRKGNKNNIEFGRKSYEIDQFVARLKAGQQVDPTEIDEALEPVHVP